MISSIITIMGHLSNSFDQQSVSTVSDHSFDHNCKFGHDCNSLSQFCNIFTITVPATIVMVRHHCNSFCHHFNGCDHHNKSFE